MFNYEVMDHGLKLSNATWNHKKKIKFFKTNHLMFTNHPNATTHRMYSHVKGTITISFVLIKHVVVDTHDTVPIVMTIRSPTTIAFTSTTLPQNLGVESLDLPKGFPRIIRRFVVPSICLYRRFELS